MRYALFICPAFGSALLGGTVDCRMSHTVVQPLVKLVVSNVLLTSISHSVETATGFRAKSRYRWSTGGPRIRGFSIRGLPRPEKNLEILCLLDRASS